MKLRTFSIVLLLALLASFAVLNWSAFTAPTALWLGFVEVQAPLGLVMLSVTATLCALFLIYILFQQAGLIFEARRFARELKAQRELADTAEASRFTELRSFLVAELDQLQRQRNDDASAVSQRIAQMEQRLHDALGDTARTLAAHLGEVEDKLDRAVPPVSPLSPLLPR
jgi:hypothetical protein